VAGSCPASFQLEQHRQAPFLTASETLLITAVLEFALDTVQFIDHRQRDISSTRLAFGLYFLGLNELASCMGHAQQTLNTGLGAHGVVVGVVVCHQIATVTIEQAQWHLLRPAGGVVKQHDFPVWQATGLPDRIGESGRDQAP